MNPDDPFAIPGDADRTVMKPSPGGRRPGSTPPQSAAPAPRAPAPQPRGTAPRAYERELVRFGINPLVSAASALLGLSSQLRTAVRHADVPGLRAHVVDEMRNFENTARAQGASQETVLAGRYALCTLMDETVLGTPWGSESAWSKQTLLTTFHNETWGGEKFFVILDRVSEDPTRNVDLMELMYLCLSLGFEGKYRVLERGRAKLEELQDNLYRRIRNVRGDFERELSEHWQGVTDQRNALIRYVPVWVVAAVAAVLLLGTYAGFNVYLKQWSDPVAEQLQVISGNEKN